MTDHQRGIEAAHEVLWDRCCAVCSPADVDAAISAYLATTEPGKPESGVLAEVVKVKPLEWHTTEDVTQNTTGVCAYKIEHWEGGGFGVYLHGYVGLHNGRCETLDEAKAIAQADYEQRVMSALSTPPHPETLQRRVEELEAALKTAKTRMRNCRGAIESNQVVDKDVHGSLTRGMADIDAALIQEQKKDG